MSTVCSLVNVSRRYGRHWALNSINITLDASEIIGLVGPNGAGKTSLLRIMAGLLQPTNGDVRRQGGEPGCARYFAGERALPPHVSANTWLRLWAGRRRDDLGRRRIAALSRGMRQQLGLEATLSTSPIHRGSSLVLLDEPWEGLDPDATRWLSAQLVEARAQGASVMVSSHRIHDLAGVCDRCVFLKRGLVVEEVRMSHSVAAGIDRSAMLFEAFDRLTAAEPVSTAERSSLNIKSC
jgi:ABC-type multidrug transport system ATPase subunit